MLTATFCCFKVDLETTLREELGPPVFDELLSTCQEEFCIPRRKFAIKNPKVIAEIIERGKERGCESATLNGIVNNVMALSTPRAEPPLVYRIAPRLAADAYAERPAEAVDAVGRPSTATPK
jgi:hypothetical protein